MSSRDDKIQNDRKDVWGLLEKQYQQGDLLTAKVVGFNEEGLLVDISGIKGLVPNSQISDRTDKNQALDGKKLVEAKQLFRVKGQEMLLKIIQVDRITNCLILSERLALQQWRQQRREELLNTLQPGDSLQGSISKFTSLGIVIDLEGAEGFVYRAMNTQALLERLAQQQWYRQRREELLNDPQPEESLQDDISELSDSEMVPNLERAEGILSENPRSYVSREDTPLTVHIGQKVEVEVVSIDKQKKRIILSLKEI